MPRNLGVLSNVPVLPSLPGSPQIGDQCIVGGLEYICLAAGIWTQRSSGGGWTPAQIPGLIGWYKASSLALNDNDPVTTWTDLSGGGRDLTSSGTNRPTYKTNIINGKAVVRFDGTDDFLSRANYTAPNWNKLFVYVVVRPTANTVNYVLMELSPNYNNNAQSWLFYRDTNNFFQVAVNKSLISAADSSLLTTANAWSFIYGWFHPAGSSNKTGIIHNGVDRWSYAANNNSDSSNFISTYTLFVGSRGGTILFLNGDVAELFIANSYPDLNTRAALEAYTKAEYGSNFNQ